MSLRLKSVLLGSAVAASLSLSLPNPSTSRCHRTSWWNSTSAWRQQCPTVAGSNTSRNSTRSHRQRWRSRKVGLSLRSSRAWASIGIGMR